MKSKTAVNAVFYLLKKEGKIMKTLLLQAHSAYMLTGLPGAPALPTTGNSSLDDTMARIMTIIFVIGIAAALIGLISLGVLFMFPSKREKAKEQWPYIIIGMAILFSAGSIVAFIAGMQLL